MDHQETRRADTCFSNFDSQCQFSDHQNRLINDAHEPIGPQKWDPRAVLNNLALLEQRVHQLQDLVRAIVNRRDGPDEIFLQQQQLVTADLTSIIVQLLSTAGSLLPSVNQTGRLEPSLNPQTRSGPAKQLNSMAVTQSKVEESPSLTGFIGHEQNVPIEDNNISRKFQFSWGPEGQHNGPIEAHESKSDDDHEEGEHLPPGSYEVLQLEKEEILAPHTHFCMICGKGFKRDANLRMHMRGHGDEYKTAAALAKPLKESSSDQPVLTKRYSCPFTGCKRNKDHRKFQPLKTILCVKNHYKRTHCDKTYTCGKCNAKKFSVMADLKTHEKHCGRDKWLCSCGTTFSRKDKLFGHIALFQGHTPAVPVEECRGFQGDERLEFDCKADGPSTGVCQGGMDPECSGADSIGYLSPLGFEAESLGGFGDFSRHPFEDSNSSLSFLFSQNDGGCSSGRME